MHPTGPCPEQNPPHVRHHQATLYASLELSRSAWLVTSLAPGSGKMSKHSVAAGDGAALLALLARLRGRVERSAGGPVGVVVVQEAGRDGFWVHRLLEAHGVESRVESWRELLLRLRDENGLVLDPELATGDGALGFWQALHEVWPKTRQQRCWVHKAANVLNKLPPSLQGKATQDLHAIYEAESRKAAEAAFDRFVAKHGAKYDKAVACLAKDREVLLAFYDFPAEHWKHVRTTNPIESTFATVRLRTDKTKGCLSRQTALAMVYKLAKAAERSWRRLDGSQRLAQVIQGVRFRDGEPVQAAEEQVAA